MNATSSSIQCLGVVFADTAAQSYVLCENVLRLHFDQLLDTVHVQTPLFQLLLHRGNLEQLETSLVNYYNITSSVSRILASCILFKDEFSLRLS